MEAFFSKPGSYKDLSRRIFELTDDLQRSLFMFESTSNQALMRVYRRSNIIATESASFSALAQNKSISMENAPANVDGLLERAGADETVFQVYLYVYLHLQACLMPPLRALQFYIHVARVRQRTC